MINLKDILTNWTALATTVGYAVLVYLQNVLGGQPFSWATLGTAVVLVLLQLITGKNPDLSVKTPEQVTKANSGV